MNNRLADDYAGRTLGQFEIVEEIGRGGMATVYRARQKSINRMVAIKVLPRALLHDSSFYERFTREVDVIAQLEHPHILPIYDFGEVNGMPYIAMRYLAGGSLAARIRRGPLTPAQIVRPLSQVAQALDYAHQQGIIHRDIKPGNILLDEQGNAYLADFGIARVLNSTLTASSIIGTPSFMSPEQGMGQPLDGRSDLYSLGIVLFELLTGSEPFSADTPVGLLLKHINDPLPSLRARRPELSPGIEAVVQKAAAKQPGDRYATASDMANALAATLSATPLRPPSIKRLSRKAPPLLPAPFEWKEVPGGRGMMATDESNVALSIPAQTYWMAKYPVTNAQYAVFIEAGGYITRRWWTAHGWQTRLTEAWTQPRYWTDATWNGADQPVVGVSWFEAVAFCQWLSERTSEKIILPTEAQWQYAAQGDDGRAYPWGNAWDAGRCNNAVDGTGIGRTTPVRQYEGKGDSRFGVADMAGNVWEWCLTAYETGRNDLDGLDARVLRGGSWVSTYADNFRCDCRVRNLPASGYNLRGFRLALTP